MNARWRSLRKALVLAALLGIALLAVILELKLWRAPTMENWQNVVVGMTQAAVRERLGPPRHEYQRETAPSDYYVSGYGRKERPITNRVLIYLERDLVLYVWIDASGQVEEVAIAPS